MHRQQGDIISLLLFFQTKESTISNSVEHHVSSEVLTAVVMKNSVEFNGLRGVISEEIKFFSVEHFS
jgi:hypothetical protein